MSQELNPSQVRAVQEALSKGLGLELQRPGLMTLWAGDVAAIPDGWLRCNGQAVSRQAFLRLFSTVGTTFGVGDGATTFNVPGVVPIASPAGTVWVIRS